MSLIVSLLVPCAKRLLLWKTHRMLQLCDLQHTELVSVMEFDARSVEAETSAQLAQQFLKGLKKNESFLLSDSQSDPDFGVKET